MSDSSLIEENGRAHFLTKRFDRQNGEKIHMQTLCGIAHYDYRNLRSYSYEQAFNIMRALRLPYSQAQEMFRRMVLKVVIRNQDDHCKNFSFYVLRDNDSNDWKWRLAPAYDLTLCSEGYNGEHATSVNGTGHPRLSDFIAVGKKIKLSEDRCREIINEVRSGNLELMKYEIKE